MPATRVECRDWTPVRCALSSQGGPVALSMVCEHFQRCIYDMGREELSDLELEVWDAWCRGDVCLWPKVLR